MSVSPFQDGSPTSRQRLSAVTFDATSSNISYITGRSLELSMLISPPNVSQTLLLPPRLLRGDEVSVLSPPCMKECGEQCRELPVSSLLEARINMQYGLIPYGIFILMCRPAPSSAYLYLALFYHVD